MKILGRIIDDMMNNGMTSEYYEYVYEQVPYKIFAVKKDDAIWLKVKKCMI